MTTTKATGHRRQMLAHAEIAPPLTSTVLSVSEKLVRYIHSCLCRLELTLAAIVFDISASCALVSGAILFPG